MSQDGAEVVRRVIDALNRGDVEGAMEATSPDCVIDWSNSRGPLRGVYHGREEAREAWKSFLELEDDRVVIASEFRTRGQGSGVEVSARGASLWTIRDDEVAAVALYQSKAEALEAAAGQGSATNT